MRVFAYREDRIVECTAVRVRVCVHARPLKNQSRIVRTVIGPRAERCSSADPVTTGLLY